VLSVNKRPYSHLIATDRLVITRVVTCHPTQVSAPHLNRSQTDLYSIYLPRRDGRLSWRWCWLYTEIVYRFAESHPSR